MQVINQQIQEIGNKILLKHKEVEYERDSNRKKKLQDELNKLYYRKEILGIRKRIKQLEGE